MPAKNPGTGVLALIAIMLVVMGCYDTFLANQKNISVNAKLAGSWSRYTSTPPSVAKKLVVGVNISQDIKWEHLLIENLFFCYTENIISGKATVVWHDPITRKDTSWLQSFTARRVWIDSTGEHPTLKVILTQVDEYAVRDTAEWEIHALTRNLLNPEPEGSLTLKTPTHTYEFRFSAKAEGKCYAF